MDKKNAFNIFPEEIWKIILEKCKNSNEIASVLEALPQLKLLARGRQCSWMIGCVLPLLFPKHIGFQDIRNCRLVSKRWKNAVDESLETHPDLVSYSSTPSLGRMSETHFNYRRLPEITTHISPCFETDNDNRDSQSWLLGKSDSILQSSKEAHVSFPGRSVCVNLSEAYSKNITADMKFQIYSENHHSIPLRVDPPEKKMFSLKNVGDQIQYITFELPGMYHWKQDLLITELIECLVHFLAYMPYLKSLKLESFGFYLTVASENMSEELTKNIILVLSQSRIPARLETLDLCSFGGAIIPTELFNSFLRLFVNHAQVKKLGINARHWTTELPNMLPNLTELCLDCRFLPKEFSPKCILKGLTNFPCLRKLCVSNSVMNVVEIIQLLSVLQIESLELIGGTFVESPTKEIYLSIVSKLSKLLWRQETGQFLNGCAPSVRNLRINAMAGMNFKFMSLLPSLQFLTFTCDDRKRHLPLQLVSANDLVSVCLYKIYRRIRRFWDWKVEKLECMKSLWETFPNLDMVTLETGNGLHQCVREDATIIYINY